MVLVGSGVTNIGCITSSTKPLDGGNAVDTLIEATIAGANSTKFDGDETASAFI